MAAIKFVSHFVPDQLFRTPRPPTSSFAGQTVIVTGSNTGLGKDAARQIVVLGAAKVILGVRNRSKGEQAKEDIERCTGRTAVLEVWQLDMSSYESIRAFSARCDTLDRIDAVIENAGISTSKFRLAENNELTITVNVVGTFLLAHLLLPKLQSHASKLGTHPHLTIVGSDLFEMAPLKARKQTRILDTMNDPNTADMGNRYPDSKLMVLLYVQALVRLQRERSRKTDVIINVVNPGFCRSELLRETSDGLAERLATAVIARSTEEGARCLVYGASSGVECHGSYMSNGVPRSFSRTWLGGEEGRTVGGKIFEEINSKLEAVVPGILNYN